MKADLDHLMAKTGVDALWVSGAAFHNPDMVYFTGVQHVTQADLFKLRGQPPVLYYFHEMEREEAARSGLQTRSYDQFLPLSELLEAHAGDLASALATRASQALIHLGIQRGQVAVSGLVAFDVMLALLEKIRALLPEVEFTSFFKDGLIQQARMTKDQREADAIREIGHITTQVVARVAGYLTTRRVRDDTLLDEHGQPLTVQAVKRKIRVWLVELGADNPEETIFSIGRDAGIPHNSGNPHDLIRLGQPIVFDIFPCQAGGSYFYDMTRTWCLGYATPVVADLHRQVLEVYQTVREQLQPGTLFKDYQELTCRLFAERRHVTLQEDYSAQEGYIHSVGHGIGLNVHESPFSGINSTQRDRLLPGVVFSVEPGLYYPSQGMGVRIEDTIYLKPDGEFEVLAPYPYDLVLPMRTTEDLEP